MNRRVLFICAIALSLSATAALSQTEVQQEQPAVPVQRPSRPATQLPSQELEVTTGRGQLVQFADEASRVSVSDPAIADAVVVSPHDPRPAWVLRAVRSGGSGTVERD